MHGLQEAEAQGLTLERGRPCCSCLYREWFSLGSPNTVCVVGMFHVFHRYTVWNTQSMHSLISLVN